MAPRAGQDVIGTLKMKHLVAVAAAQRTDGGHLAGVPHVAAAPDYLEVSELQHGALRHPV